MTLDPTTRWATVAERQVRLTLTEVRLLLALAHHRGRVVHRNTLLASVWGRDVVTASSRLSMAVSRLRAKIGYERITTVHGWGYTLSASSLEDRRGEAGPEAGEAPGRAGGNADRVHSVAWVSCITAARTSAAKGRPDGMTPGAARRR